MLRWTGGARAEATQRANFNSDLVARGAGKNPAALNVEVVPPPPPSSVDGRSVRFNYSTGSTSGFRTLRSRKGKRGDSTVINFDILAMFPPKRKRGSRSDIRRRALTVTAADTTNDDDLNQVEHIEKPTRYRELLELMQGGANLRPSGKHIKRQLKESTGRYQTRGMKSSSSFTPQQTPQPMYPTIYDLPTTTLQSSDVIQPQVVPQMSYPSDSHMVPAADTFFSGFDPVPGDELDPCAGDMLIESLSPTPPPISQPDSVPLEPPWFSELCESD